MNLSYPAIFHQEDNGFWVEFPDLEGCFSQGDTFQETFENAKESLEIYCLSMLDDNEILPKPTPLNKIISIENSFTSIVETDTTQDNEIYRNLPIPAWLIDEAVKNNINFTQILEQGIMRELQLN